jgi:hypothetical protein
MLERLGRRKFFIPVLIIIVVFFIMSIMMYPMLNANPKDVPFAVLSLDEGATTPAGELNLGDKLVENMSAGLPDVESPIEWTVLDSQEALDKGFADNAYYGALVIPADFSAKQAAAQMAALASAGGGAEGLPEGVTAGGTPTPEQLAALAESGDLPEGVTAGETPTPEQLAALAAAQEEAANASPSDADTSKETPAPTPDIASAESPTVQLIINSAKNAMLTTQLQQLIPTMLESNGITVDVTNVNTADIGGGGMMSAIMGPQLLLMPLVMLLLSGSLLLYFIFRPRKSALRHEKTKSYLVQICYSVASSFLIALAAIGIVTWAGGMDLPVGALLLFLWPAVFCVMLLFLGAFSLSRILGALVAVFTFACGMSVTMLASEMMPTFWRDYIYPLVPQHYIMDGVRTIIYMDNGANFIPLLIYGAIGVALFLIAILTAKKVAVREA